MRWNTCPPFGPSVIVDRTRLRRAALRYAAHGWPVTPGAVLAGHRFVCGRAGCPTTGAHPALDGWEGTATTDVPRVAAWWQHRPHTVLLATGTAFDVLDVPAKLGMRVLGASRLGADDLRGPVAVTPTGRWMFLVRPGDPLRPELEASLDVVRHGRGSWIPAPPTRTVEGRVQWTVSPEHVRWLLPGSYAVQDMLVDALGRSFRPARRAA
jgi:hypothetical protein